MLHILVGIATNLSLLYTINAQEFNLNPRLLRAVCWVESKHNPKAINLFDGPSPSYGLCQVKLETARFLKFRGTGKQLMHPRVNSYYAAKYLAYQLARYDYDWTKATIAYNHGHYCTFIGTGYLDMVTTAIKEGR